MASLSFWGLLGFGGYQLVVHPQTPLPPHWNPTVPLAVSHPITPLTNFKLGRTLEGEESCFSGLTTAAVFERQPAFETSEQCHIKSRLILEQVGQSTIRKTDTRCDTALRLAMWEQHGIQVAAQKHFDQAVTAIRTQGSYNCRKIGGSDRMSQHAQARAIDVAGFTLADGTVIELIDHWSDAGAKSEFLRNVRDSSCKWFKTTLGPDFNAAHADHFHLQTKGWGTCR